jgi:hypothetical protein
MSVFPRWPLPLRFLYQIVVWFFSFFCVRLTSIANSIPFNLIALNIRWTVNITKHLSCNFFPSSKFFLARYKWRLQFVDNVWSDETRLEVRPSARLQLSWVDPERCTVMPHGCCWKVVSAIDQVVLIWCVTPLGDQAGAHCRARKKLKI